MANFNRRLSSVFKNRLEYADSDRNTYSLSLRIELQQLKVRYNNKFGDVHRMTCMSERQLCMYVHYSLTS